MSQVASAPGKAMLIGEYAVLEGAPSIVTAVDVRAHAYAARADVDEARPVSDFVAAAREASGVAVEGAPIVETVGFVSGRRKIGLGSSAAVTAAVVGHAHLESGKRLDAAARGELLNLAQSAHHRAQGGRGSGADVAASVLGGTLSYRERVPTPLDWPSWLHVTFFDAGAPASTTAFLARVEAGKARNPQPHAEAMRKLTEASQAFHQAFASDDASAWPQLKSAVALHVEGLQGLQDNSEAPILTEAIRTVIREASALGLAAKPSGAGGGDLVVVFAPQASALDRLAYQLRERHGIHRAANLTVHAEGLRAEERPPLTSRLPGLFRQDAMARRARIGDLSSLDTGSFRAVDQGGLGSDAAEHMAENVLGTFELPIGVATNFRINGRDVLVPMCTEEASVIAAASNAAKMIRAGGGFVASSDPPWMVTQVQLKAPEGESEPDLEQVRQRVLAARDELLALADQQHPRLVQRGGGARELQFRVLDPHNVVVELLVDCRDAMGANLLNTVAEACAPELERLTGWTSRLRILSNLADRRRAHVSAEVPVEVLGIEDLSGLEVARLILDASRFAELDPYRATTHNKGIMNGVDAVVIATGNDWRAVEAAAHAFAASTGAYRPLAIWRLTDDGTHLRGELSMPMALGVVGGATRAHPAARMALELMEHPNSTRLGQIVAAAGLASNLAALRALATEGIQRGHMSLHARAVALSAGAQGEELEILAKRLVDVGEIKRERALALLQEIRNES